MEDLGVPVVGASAADAPADADVGLIGVDAVAAGEFAAAG